MKNRRACWNHQRNRRLPAMVSFPAASLLPVFILGVLAIDLTFDVGGLPPLSTVTYYTGHRTCSFPANLFVIAGIVVGAIPIVAALMRPQLVDIISFGILIGALGAFVGYLIPVQVGKFGAQSLPFVDS